MDYKRGVLQRTNAPRVSYVNPSRSQLEAFRRPSSMTFACFFHETTRKIKVQQPAAQTHRFTQHIVYMSESFPRVEYLIRSLSAVVHLPYQRWCGRKDCVFFPLRTLGMLSSWCTGLKSTCVVISASQQSLVIAHDMSIFVAAFRRGPRGVQQGKS